MTNQRKPGWAFWTAVTLLNVLLVLYPLSIGPAWRVCEHDWGASGSEYAIGTVLVPPRIAVAYRPLFWLAEHFEPFWKVLDWYADLWFPQTDREAT